MKKEKIPTLSMIDKYPMQFVVMVEVEWAPVGPSQKIGYFHSVHDTREEASRVKRELGDSKGSVSIVEGHNPKLQIGGIVNVKPFDRLAKG